MLENAVKGAMAGLAGMTALNAATYVDMVWRGRPASSTPEQVIEELAKRSGRTIPGDSHERPNRVQAMGALAGIAAGVTVGAGVHRPGRQLVVERRVRSPRLIHDQRPPCGVARLADPGQVRARPIRGRADDQRPPGTRMRVQHVPELPHVVKNVCCAPTASAINCSACCSSPPLDRRSSRPAVASTSERNTAFPQHRQHPRIDAVALLVTWRRKRKLIPPVIGGQRVKHRRHRMIHARPPHISQPNCPLGAISDTLASGRWSGHGPPTAHPRRSAAAPGRFIARTFSSHEPYGGWEDPGELELFTGFSLCWVISQGPPAHRRAMPSAQADPRRARRKQRRQAQAGFACERCG
jgi:hypothetical protein